jgi:uncharacterized protein
MKRPVRSVVRSRAGKTKPITEVSTERAARMFLRAVDNGKIVDVKRLLKMGVEINDRQEDGPFEGKTALHLAVGGDRQLLNLLIDAGADWSIPDSGGFTPLAQAAAFGDCAAILEMVDAGANVNHWVVRASETDVHWAYQSSRLNLERGSTPLHAAAENGELAAVSLLIEKGGYVRATDNMGRTPLHSAALWDHRDVAQKLVDEGALVWVRDKNGGSPVSAAAALCATATLELFLFGPQGRAGVFECEGIWGNTCQDARTIVDDALTKVVSRARIVPSASVLSVDEYNFALSFDKRQAEAVSILLDAGAHPDARDRDGHVPWITAILSGCDEAVGLFRDKVIWREEREVVDLADYQGVTALMRETARVNQTGVDALLAHGADANKQDPSGNTPLHHSLNGYRREENALIAGARERFGNVVSSLRRAGADADISNKGGLTPRQDAARRGLQEFF